MNLLPEFGFLCWLLQGYCHIYVDETLPPEVQKGVG